MNIILLSGGSGKRLWPLSNDIRSKQFIKIFKNEKDEYESMLERMYRSIKKTNKDSIVTVATSKSQASIISNQIGDDVNISVEPCRKNTFPAIVLACAYLSDMKHVSLDETILVCPVDPLFEQDYCEALEKLYHLHQNSNYNLSLMGIVPTYPSEKYGYIIPKTTGRISEVMKYKEKPLKNKAEEYIQYGALWNSGVFAFRLSYILNIAHELLSFKDYHDLYNQYESLNDISFDCAVLEHEKSIQVMRFDGLWKDLGTWNTLTESMKEPILGKGTMDDKCFNTHIINELNIPILAMGLKNIVVAASSDGILVSNKEDSSYIASYVDQIEQPIRYAEKSWGSYRVIDVQDESSTILVTLHEKNKMKYHSHDYRNEIWNVISGEGKVIVDGMEQFVKPGDVVTIQAGCKHTIIAITELKVVEVQLGKGISVNDKHKYELEDE